jgi:hypothetical protein
MLAAQPRAWLLAVVATLGLAGCHLLLPLRSEQRPPLDAGADRPGLAADLVSVDRASRDAGVSPDHERDAALLKDTGPKDTGPVDTGPVDLLASWCTCSLADANRDGKVDQSDLDYLATCFGEVPTGGCVAADLNHDGVIDIRDLACVSKMLGGCSGAG